jgi:serine protease Do
VGLVVVACVALAACAGWRGGTQHPAPSLIRVETAHAAGSGFFITPTLVATTAHVLADDRTATLVLDAGQRRAGRVVLVDRRRDVALVRSPVAGTPLPVREDVARDGEPVTAIGFSPGRPGAITSRGAVRSVLDAMIVHDARLEPGVSGGPLLDAQGRVLGVNAIASRGGRAGRQLDRGLAVKIAAVLDGLAVVARSP